MGEESCDSEAKGCFVWNAAVPEEITAEKKPLDRAGGDCQ